MMLQTILQKHTNTNDYIYGLANVSGLLSGEYADYKYGIVIGKRLDNTIVDKITGGPTPEYYDHYKNTNKELTELAIDISDKLNINGIQSIATAPSLGGKKQDSKYKKYLSLDISHKMLATRAGLGWIGKSALFISYKFGPRVRLVSILTNTLIEFCNTPVNESQCGDCNICVEKCPARAANGIPWNTTIYRDNFFDANKCREMCRIQGKKHIGFDASICGICVAVCPFGN
ncbi:epoxyqueuosine reductase [candidate division KSB1 bacterium]|nr:epoxyqueuosine reductase [candidate division KSB1 bacterium]